MICDVKFYDFPASYWYLTLWRWGTYPIWCSGFV